MKRYVEIAVRVGGTIPVDCDSDEEAIELAKAVARNRFTKFCIAVSPPYPDDIVIHAEVCRPAPDDVKTETYICNRCNRPSPKTEWGPGRVMCPLCHSVALSVAEVAFLATLPTCTCAYGQIGWATTSFAHACDCPWFLALCEAKRMVMPDGSLVEIEEP